MNRDKLLSKLKNSDGRFIPSRVTEMVDEFITLQSNAEDVYKAVTGGVLSNWNYSSDIVLSVYDSLQKDKLDRDTVCEDMLHMFGQDGGSKQLILEYFGKLY